ncbi:MAG: PHP domain-containing protein, partial [Ignavibacterium sp.]|nr:PHP domain-containing protein [Ignavibacterium sp.]MDW8374792.1 PHP domain-containing protein [Ignavibacteriales bacterium]
MIPLHVHSCYSLLRGTFDLNSLIKKAKEEKLQSIALTDTNAVYGLVNFYKLSKEQGIKPILGVYIDNPKNKDEYILLLAKNSKGYSDICRITTLRNLREDFEIKFIVEQIWNNLIFISPSIDILKQINRENDFYAEIFITKASRKRMLKVYDYAIKEKIKIVATNPIYFIEQDDYEIHKLLRAIDSNTTISNLPQDELVDKEFYFKSIEAIKNSFRKIPEAIKNTFEIAEECNVELELGKYKLPHFRNEYSNNNEELFLEILYKGFSELYPNPDEKTFNRLNYEVEVIKSLGYVDYFLIVWDILQEAKRRGMLTIGRGSAANSIVAYCLGITQIDPIKYNLYFERFLNKARSNPPDIDIDFSWKERDDIIKYVFEKYGYENVAMISTHVTFRARSAFRETAKAYGISDREISEYSKKIPWTSAKNLANINQLYPESRSLNFSIEPWKTIVNLATKISDFPRHL